MNELPLSFYTLLVVIQAMLVFYVLFDLKSDIPHVFAAGISAFLGYMNANMILNGNVVMIAATTTQTTYIPVQSLPVHYTLLGLAAIMTLITAYLTIDYVRGLFESQKESEFGFGGF